jgi:hypothetical protein
MLHFLLKHKRRSNTMNIKYIVMNEGVQHVLYNDDELLTLANASQHNDDPYAYLIDNIEEAIEELNVSGKVYIID